MELQSHYYALEQRVAQPLQPHRVRSLKNPRVGSAGEVPIRGGNWLVLCKVGALKYSHGLEYTVRKVSVGESAVKKSSSGFPF